MMVNVKSVASIVKHVLIMKLIVKLVYMKGKVLIHLQNVIAKIDIFGMVMFVKNVVHGVLNVKTHLIIV